MSVLKARQLSKVYTLGNLDVSALVDVTLSIESGEFVAIMGASGSGKSTLLHLLGGLDDASSGDVVIDGANLSAQRERELTKLRRRRIGFVFQSFNLITVLTALENVALPLLIDGIKPRDANARAGEILKAVGLEDRADHFPDALSGGEQQRAAVARALVTEPAIVLADEPTGNLDSVNSEEMMRLLRRLCDEKGQTIILVTHDSRDASFADRVIFLKDGLVADETAAGDGDIDEIIRRLAKQD